MLVRFAIGGTRLSGPLLGGARLSRRQNTV